MFGTSKILRYKLFKIKSGFKVYQHKDNVTSNSVKKLDSSKTQNKVIYRAQNKSKISNKAKSKTGNRAKNRASNTAKNRTGKCKISSISKIIYYNY